VLGLGDDAPLAAPALQRAPGEVGEAAHRAALSQALRRGRDEFVGDGTGQAIVTGEAEDVVDPVRLAPRHELVPGEARVGPEQDLDPGPAGADLADDALDLGHGAGRGVDVRAPELYREQLAAAEHVQRQIAVAVIIAIRVAWR
jgi:hypothetical protein